MRLLIAKDKAIQILQDRIAGLHAYDFNAEAWKERTVLDLKEIFPLGSTQYLKIEFLRFDTYVVAEKHKVMLLAQQTAEQILKSYIEFIEEYSKVAEERKVVVENDYKTKYSELMTDRNNIVTDYNELVKKYEDLLGTNSELIDTNENLINQIEVIRRDTIQIDNVSLSKLTKAFFNLPVWQIVATFSVIAGVLIGLFGLGKVYQENADNNHIFDYKTEINKLNEENRNDSNKIIDLEEKVNQQKKIIDSLNKK